MLVERRSRDDTDYRVYPLHLLGRPLFRFIEFLDSINLRKLFYSTCNNYIFTKKNRCEESICRVGNKILVHEGGRRET